MWPVYLYFLFTVRKRSCGKLMFYTCLSVILFTRGVLPQCMLGYTPPTPWDQRHPQEPEADTPQDQRQTPPGQTPPPPEQTLPADTPLADTPGQTPPRPTPPGRHSPGRHPPADGCCCGRYASFWNAYLFVKYFYFQCKQKSGAETSQPNSDERQ